MQDWFVVVMGLCTVFVVLTLIILLCYLLGALCRGMGKKEEKAAQEAAKAAKEAEAMTKSPTVPSLSRQYRRQSPRPAAPTLPQSAFCPLRKPNK